MAPMSLVTYQETRPWARSIRARVQAREMPPWHLDKTVGIQHFINDRSLTDEQIDTIVRWGRRRSALGRPRRHARRRWWWPAGDRFELEDRLGPPDIVVESQPVDDARRRPGRVVPGRGAEVSLPGSVWVRASETKPSREGRRIVHHASTYLIQPKGGGAP